MRSAGSDLLSVNAGPLRLAFVASLRPGEASGAARAATALIGGLQRRGYVLDLCTDGLADQQVIGLGDQAAAQAAMQQRLATHHATLTERWRFVPPDLVHVEIADGYGHVAQQVAAQLGIAVSSRFHALHAFAPPAMRDHGLRLLLAFHRRVACTIAQTTDLGLWLARQGLPEVETIGNGVDAERFHPRQRSVTLRTQWVAGDDTPVALWVGQLRAEKNTALLLRCANALHERLPSARLVVVGDGPQARDLRRALPWAVFTGVLRDDALAAAYASADALLFPSRIDSWGHVVLEAMASATAPVAFARAAAATCGRDGLSAALVQEGDDQSFIARALDLFGDLPRCRLMGAEARRDAEQFSWDATIDRYEALFHRLSPR